MPTEQRLMTYISRIFALIAILHRIPTLSSLIITIVLSQSENNAYSLVLNPDTPATTQIFSWDESVRRLCYPRYKCLNLLSKRTSINYPCRGPSFLMAQIRKNDSNLSNLPVEHYVDDDMLAIEEDAVIGNENNSLIESQRGEESKSSLKLEKPKKKSKTQLKADLKQYRKDMIVGTKKPLYTIFTNAAIDDISTILPTTKEELLQVRGIGPKKLEMFGDDIILMVTEYISSQETAKSKNGNDQNVSGAANSKLPPRPINIDPKTLTHEQRRAADFALSSDCPNVFITGPAGTGKSYLLKYLVQELKKRQLEYHPSFTSDFSSKKKFGVVAPTGVAAVNVEGTTLHSYFGIGLGRGSISSLVKKVKKNKAAAKRIDETDILIIDECSMLSSFLLEVLDAVAREVRHEGQHADVPFGGMQIICFGDFFQLPPIPDRDSEDWDFRPFCFDSIVWSELGLRDNVIMLQEIQRQENTGFINLLNKVRIGNVSLRDISELNSRCLISKSHPIPTDGIIPTRLYVLNKDVDLINESRLAELDGDEIIIKAANEWRESMPDGTPIALKKAMSESLSKELPDEVRLKVGAQVMLTRNKDLERNLVNGSRGVVVSLEKGAAPLVRFDCGIVTSIPRVESVRYNPDGSKGCLVRTQIPLKLAWAVTVHKSQGTTLSRALLDISKAFEYGQCYVALSRVKNLEGLWLERPAKIQNIKVSPQVVDFFKFLSC